MRLAGAVIADDQKPLLSAGWSYCNWGNTKADSFSAISLEITLGPCEVPSRFRFVGVTKLDDQFLWDRTELILGISLHIPFAPRWSPSIPCFRSHHKEAVHRIAPVLGMLGYSVDEVAVFDHPVPGSCNGSAPRKTLQ